MPGLRTSDELNFAPSPLNWRGASYKNASIPTTAQLKKAIKIAEQIENLQVELESVAGRTWNWQWQDPCIYQRWI